MQSLKVLGVTLNSNLGMSEHIGNLVSKAGQVMYALKTLKHSGLAMRPLDIVSNSTLVSPIIYASPAWWGFASLEDCGRLQGVFNKAARWGLCSSPPNFQNICDKADCKFFSTIKFNPSHVLHPLLPPERNSDYNLRPRAHNYTLPINTPSLKRNFLNRILFRDSY